MKIASVHGSIDYCASGILALVNDLSHLRGFICENYLKILNNKLLNHGQFTIVIVTT